MQEIEVQSQDKEDPLEEDTETHFSMLAWRIPWTEEPWGLQSIASQRLGHACSKQASVHALNKRNTIPSKRDEYTQIITRQNMVCLWDAKCVVGWKEKHFWATRGFGEDKWTRTWRLGITDKEMGMKKEGIEQNKKGRALKELSHRGRKQNRLSSSVWVDLAIANDKSGKVNHNH